MIQFPLRFTNRISIRALSRIQPLTPFGSSRWIPTPNLIAWMRHATSEKYTLFPTPTAQRRWKFIFSHLDGVRNTKNELITNHAEGIRACGETSEVWGAWYVARTILYRSSRGTLPGLRRRTYFSRKKSVNYFSHTISSANQWLPIHWISCNLIWDVWLSYRIMKYWYGHIIVNSA